MSSIQFTGAGTGFECSHDKKYKYVQYTRWDLSLPAIMFILLNPSGDPQEKIKVKRCFAYSKASGFGAAYVTYLFAYRTPYVQELGRAWHVGVDIIGPENNLVDIGLEVDQVVFAWGPWGGIGNRDREIVEKLQEKAWYIELSAAGYPRDPGSLGRRTLLQKYSTTQEPMPYNLTQ